MSAIQSPYVDVQGKPQNKGNTPLAIERPDFVFSSEARGIRVLAEYEEFPRRMRNAGIRGTFLVFGSARAMYQSDWDAKKAKLAEDSTNKEKSEKDQLDALSKIKQHDRIQWMCHWMDVTEELCRKLSAWSLSPEGQVVGRGVRTHFPSGNAEQPIVICTGGGPGFMEAANKGAASVPKSTSMGVAVTLPFESSLNPYVTDGLDFKFEYFFSRKFWEVYCAKAMILSPGGMGTCDEMFEVLTLMQTGHCPKLPVVFVGKKFWNDVINFQKLAEYGVCSQVEIDTLCFADDAETAFQFIVQHLQGEAEAMKTQTTPRKKE